MRKAYDYVVEFKRVTYVRVPLLASDDDDAEYKAWEMLEDKFNLDDADWDVESIERGDEYKGEE